MARSRATEKGRRRPAHARKRGVKPGDTQGRGDWRRRYYIPHDEVLRAARDLVNHSLHDEIEDYAGRMFALQDLVDGEELDKIALIEKESDSPFFLTIVKTVRREALAGDLDFARSVAGEFLEEASRLDPETVRAWFRYQNRIRQRRIDSGLGLIDPPDYTSEADPVGEKGGEEHPGPPVAQFTLTIKLSG